MNRLKIAGISTALLLVVGGCASYTAQQRAHQAAQTKNWDEAVVQYTKAVELNPSSLRYKIDLQHAKLEASRTHFEKGKSLETAAFTERGPNQYRLAQLAATELELTVKLDPTNQWAAVELGKIVQLMQDYNRSADKNSIEEIKKRASGAKAQPPVLNPASDQPISLSFPRETPVKDIYRALGNAFGINILFDQAVKNDSIAIELKDVTAQQALERVMQAANHFYKVLDEHTIIVIPDNPQARRDYEDLVIRTFYLSNGDAEQVTNVVRTMLEARNVFPLKALNAITIRDTADKVRIAEKIIDANDKAKAEVVVDVEVLQLDEDHVRDIGAFISNTGPDFVLSPVVPTTTAKDSAGNTTTINSPVTINTLRQLNSKTFTFNIPTVTYSFLKSLGETQTLANPELRISEGEKATLHIGSRVPVPISTFNSLAAGTTAVGAVSPVTSFQYQDIGIKVGIEPRVHHNREVTLKLTVEVSDLGPDKTVAGQSLPTFVTRTIEDTIRLKDGETNFLAGLIQESNQNHDDKTPFLGDIPFLGRLFTENKAASHRTDLMLTMTPHIVRIPDITEEDAAPMWVGTQNNLTFRGVSPRIESRTSGDPFAVQTNVNGRDSSTGLPLAPDGEPGNIMQPPSGLQPVTPAPNGPRGNGRARPNENGPEGANRLQPPSPVPPATTTVAAEVAPVTKTAVSGLSAAATAIGPAIAPPLVSDANIAAGFTPRIAPQPFTMSFKPGIEQQWTVVGMDLDGLTTNQLVMHFDPQALNVADVTVGGAIKFDPKKPPVVNIDNSTGTIRISTSDGMPLTFNSGGDVAQLRARGGLTGNTFLVIDNPSLKNGRGEAVAVTISGGHVNVE